MFKKILLICSALLILPMLAFAGSYGKISGKILDKETGEPIIGASVQIDGTVMGASTDLNGAYVILNVPIGTYTLKCSQVGYQAYTIKNIRVQSDLTTSVDFKLSSQAIQVNAIEITAERPLIEKNATSSVTTITAEDIRNLPVRNVENFAALQTGVVNATNYGIVIRGGRPDEVAYYIDGVRITNVLNGGRAISIINNSLEEVQILSGGYNAEYGQANAGIIKSSTKTGSSSYKASLELRTDSWAKPGKKVANTYSYGDNDYTLTLSGPILPNNNSYKFFLAGEYLGNRDDPNWNPGLVYPDAFEPAKPTDNMDLNWPAGVTKKNYWRSDGILNGNVVMDFKPFQVRVGGTYSYFKRSNGYAWLGFLNPDRNTMTEGYNASANLKLTHILSASTFYNLNLNYFNFYNVSYESNFKYNLAAYGDSIQNAKYGFNIKNSNGSWISPDPIYLWGIWQFPRYGAFRGTPAGFNFDKQRQTSIGASFDITHQIGITHEIKAGGEFTQYTMRFYGYLNLNNGVKSNPDDNITKLFNDIRGNNYGYDVYGNILDDGLFRARKPIFAAAYFQDKIEFSDIVLNLGLRFDYIKTDGWDLVDKSNIKFDANGIIKEKLDDGSSQIIETPAYKTVSPRIGLSFPLSDRTVFYAQYGNFVQQSRLRDIITGLGVASNNIKGGYAIGNPIGFGVGPERTTQYEIGFKQQISDNLAFDLSAYYKDIKDQIQMGLQVRSAGSSNESYYAYYNGDFSTIKGVEFKLNLRRTQRVSAQFSYSFSDSKGTGSKSDNGARFYILWQGPAGTPQFPTYVQPLDFDYAHKGNAYVDYRFGDNDGGPILSNLGLNLLASFRSGHPFTKVGTDGNYGNSRIPTEPIGASTTPWFYNLDFRIDKTVSLGPLACNVYVQVYNLLNTKNVVNVFPQTGTASDNGFLSVDEGKKLLQNSGNPDLFAMLYKFNTIDIAGNYANPRTVYLGLRLDF